MPDATIHQSAGNVGAQIGYAEIVHVYGDASAQPIIDYLRQIVAEFGPLRDSYIDLEGSGAPAPPPQSADPFAALHMVTPRLYMEAVNTEPVESVQAALNAHKRLVMLGDPGAGKSMSLRVLLATAAARHLADAAAHPLPLLLNLGAWPSDAPTLRAYIEQYLPVTPPGGAKLLLLLDGLNEMGGENREKRIESIREYLRAFDMARVIVTCREKDYTEALDLKLPKLLVAPLDDARVQQLLAAYLPVTHEALWGAIQPKAREKIFGEEKRALLELARNPYLLTILAYIYHQNGSLPQNTAGLFEQMVALRHSHEEQARERAPFDLPTLGRALGDLAFAMIDQDKGTSVDRAWAVDLLGMEGDALIRFGEACSLLVDSGSEVRFYHPLMQEYFAALALNWKDVDLSDKMLWGIWDELLLIRAEMGPEARAAVVAAYIAALRDADALTRWYAAEALGQIGDVRAIEPLIAVLRDERVQNNAAEALGRIGKPAVLPLIDALRDTDVLVREHATWALCQIGDSAVLPLIAALRDADEQVLAHATAALGHIRDGRAVEPLIDMLQDADIRVRILAVLALADIADTRAVEPLKKLLTDQAVFIDEDKEIEMRFMAAAVLAQFGDPGGAGVLKEAIKDQNEVVRFTAALALAQLGDASGTDILWKNLQNDSLGIRDDARRALRKLGLDPDNPTQTD